MTSDDSQLIEATLEGDREAFGNLVLKYQDRLFGTLFQILGSRHDAADVAQEAFLLAYRNLETFRKESSFYSWLFRIAYNAAVTNRRKAKRGQKTGSVRQTETPEQLIDANPSTDPSSRLQSEEYQSQVQQALDELGADYRDAIVLKEIEGLQYDEIAKVLGCPIGTVRSRIHRARQVLRERLARVTDREEKS